MKKGTTSGMRVLGIFLFLFCLNVNLFAQSKSELERKKQQLNSEIAATTKILKETQRNKAATLSQLKTLNRQIQIREQLIGTINSEINFIDKQTNQNTQTIRLLEGQLTKLKKEYAGMVLFAFRNQSSYNKLMFVFAAKDFNQAYKRLKYLQQFSDYREKQAFYIEQTQGQLSTKVTELKTKKQQKSGLLTEEQKEKKTLGLEKEDKTKIAVVLQSKEQQLKKDLKEKQAAQARLNRAIEDIIRREIDLARKKAEADARAKAGTKPGVKTETKPISASSALNLTPEAAKLSADFASNMGKLPWPVEKGTITEGFGQHPHPILKGITTQNNGVDIKTNVNATVRALFAGEVTGIITIPGGQIAILVRHGEYVSVYSNLKSYSVKRGDKVTTKQAIGVAFTDTIEDQTEVHLEIWKGMTKLDPQNWLFK